MICHGSTTARLIASGCPRSCFSRRRSSRSCRTTSDSCSAFRACARSRTRRSMKCCILWAGLGYYARGRNLHRAAVRIRDEFGGEFPRSFDDIASLPGIGRSTAGAILALSRGKRFPILDGNVKRVLSRFFGVQGDLAERANLDRLWELAENCTPHQRVDVYTQAIMDLGATICVQAQAALRLLPARGALLCAIHRAAARDSRAAPRARTPHSPCIHAGRNEAGWQHSSAAPPRKRRLGRPVVPAGVRHGRRSARLTRNST